MSKDTVQAIFTVIIIILLSIFATVTLFATFARLRHGFNLDYAEGVTVANVIYLWKGEGLYRDVSSPPYLMALYTPLYYLLLTPFAPLFSRVLLAGRLVSFVCLLAVGAMVFSAVRRRTGGVAIPAISCGLLLSSYVFFVDSSLAQINLLAICLSVLGVWILSARGNKALAFILFLLAIYTKQTLIGGICAASIWIGITERPLRGLRYFLLFCISAGIVFAIINFATGGQFLLHAVGYRVNPVMPKLGILFYSDFFYYYIVIIVVSIFGLSWRKPSVWQVYFVVGMLLAAASAKEGSGPVYFAEALVGLLVSFGFALGKLRESGSRGYVVILALVIAQISMALPNSRKRLREGLELPGREAGLRLLSARVRSTDGPVLTESADLSFMCGKDYIYQGPEPRLWDGGLGAFECFKPPGILKGIEERRFRLIAEYLIYRSDPEVMQLIWKYYYRAPRTYPSPLPWRRYKVWIPRRKIK